MNNRIIAGFEIVKKLDPQEREDLQDSINNYFHNNQWINGARWTKLQSINRQRTKADSSATDSIE